MVANLLRTLVGYLSAWYPNKKISKKKDLILRKQILHKIDKIKINNKNLKKTHQNFNKELLDLLKNKNIKNFLRKNFIQKMFFLQNRLFIFKELIDIKRSKKWKTYKKLLNEDHVGNPIRYFLYLKSSGNRINHVYHINILENELNINLKKNVKKVFEFGAGYGCMARIFSKINKEIKYVCFDTKYGNLLQYYYLKHNNLDVGFKKNSKILLVSDIRNNYKKKYDLFIANWSISETPIKFRKKFFSNISHSKNILISFQKKFENIDNLKYFNNLKSKLSKKFMIKIIKNKYYKGNIFFKQSHYFFLAKRL
ncbi:hypothetical protein N9T21_00700 [Candidatus Pelagibacter sp.]|nr:hypothetical protein [Candidatus Pelagibacter sp.]